MLLLTLFACTKDADGDGILDDFDCDAENPDLTLEVMAWADEDGGRLRRRRGHLRL